MSREVQILDYRYLNRKLDLALFSDADLYS